MTKYDTLENIIEIIRRNNLGRKGLKKRIRNLKKTSYGRDWQRTDRIVTDRYVTLFERTPLIHRNFMNFIKEKNEVKTILEIGCGTGIYPIKFKELFCDKKYVGIDISKPAIDFCKKNSNFDFICDDFIKMDLQNQFDLVFSHSVIDHVYDINSFLSKIIKITKNYAYISAYRGYFPYLETHRGTWDNEKGCYYNDLSVKEIKNVLIQNGLEEKDFSIRKQPSGIQLNQSFSIGLDGFATIIEIQKESIK